MRPILYFCHGLPGSPLDADLLDKTVSDTYQVIAADFLPAYSNKGFEGIVEAFDRDIDTGVTGPVTLVGFSLGAMIAMQLAAARPDKVVSLKLVSPAAPLSLGVFLPDMAGKPVFTLASEKPRLLALLTLFQGVLTRFVPGFLIKQLFQKSGQVERNLLSEAQFKTTVESGLQHSFCEHSKAYQSLLRYYVSDWSNITSEIKCPVEIWHGDQDKWAPVSMSHALCEEFVQKPKLHVVPGAEHYSTLTAANMLP
jgi:pimeloyl-ACP methyl ester carboxylesterase